MFERSADWQINRNNQKTQTVVKRPCLLWITIYLQFITSSRGNSPGAIHYPDLVTLAPSAVGVEFRPATSRKFLRFSNQIVNLGEGPLEVTPFNHATEAVTDAIQRLYSHDSDNRWYPAGTNSVGRFAFHPEHDHWHFEDFALYQVRNVAADGALGANVLATSAKVSFCLVDDYLFDPVRPHQGAQTYTHCDQIHPQGISVGWTDLYHWRLAGQEVEITTLPDGEYWLVSTVDPDDHLNEGGGPAEINNTAAVKFHLGHEIVWLDDTLPEGAATAVSGGDSWRWVTSDPPPFSGTRAHQSALHDGIHEHFFKSAETSLPVNTNNTLFTYVFLDPAHVPSEVMLQWGVATNSEHRAYWGTNGIALGTDGTASRRYIGPVPSAGEWVRLEVPANLVELEGGALREMHFILLNGRAAWDYSGVTVAPPFPGATNPPPITVAPINPVVTSYSNSALGLSIELTDGTTPVKSDSIRLTLDGTAVSPVIRKTGAATTIKYEPAAPWASESKHTVELEFSDTASTPMTQVRALDFVIPKYTLVPPEFAIAPETVDRAKPGFKVRPYQTDVNNPSRLAWTEAQLAGENGPNLANLASADTDGFFARAGDINFSLGADIGNFPGDVPFPGLPGTGAREGGTANSAVEVLAFLEFPSPGFHVLGVNSDDGFRVTTGANARDQFSLKLGEFDGTRDPSDTHFNILVPQAGIYPFRLIWGHGGGSAGLEWFTVQQGDKILLNDSSALNSIKAFREGATRPYVKAVSPFPGTADVPKTNGVRVVLADGSVPVQNESVQLFLNGRRVEASATRTGSLTTVTYTPPELLAPESTNTVRLIYAGAAVPPWVMTNDFSFVVAPDVKVLAGLDQAQVWRYDESGSDLGAGWKEKNFDDSSWKIGAALFVGKSGALPELPEPVRTGLTISSRVATYFFRTHFNFTGNPAGARLWLRHIIDDGAVFYLNGAEIHRIGMSAGPAAPLSLAARTVDNAVFEGPFDIPTQSLISGDNVLAVEVHQSSSSSSDVIMGVQLLSVFSNPPRTRIDSLKPGPGFTEVDRDTTIEITLGDGTQKVEPQSIQLFVSGQAVTPVVNRPNGGPWTRISFRPAQSLPPESKVAVKLVFHDDASPPNLTTREFSFTTAPGLKVLVAVDDKQMWRYDDSGKDWGAAWKDREFDDSAWKLGAALFAGKRGTLPPLPESVRTTLTVGATRTNFYFRTHFNFAGNPALARLQIKAVIDDGAVFYLNGSEIFRLGMEDGPVTASTLASRTVEDAGYEGPVEVLSGGLVSGDNVLAVEVHQASASSSDVTLAAQLLTHDWILPPPPAPPKFTDVAWTGAGLKLEWIGPALLQSADAVTGPWNDLARAASPFIALPRGPAQFYRLKP